MRKDLRNSILFILLIVILPVVINWILGICTPFNIRTIGENKDWLSFYGSYLGGIIAASIAFVILNKTINFNKREAEKIRRKQDLNKLENQLADDITFLNFYKIGVVALVIKDDLMSKAEILRLEDFSYELIRKSNALHLIYEDNIEPYVVKYISKFDACIEQMTQDINEMTKLISNLPTTNISDCSKSDLRGKILSQIEREISNHKSHKEIYAMPVYNAAKEWLKQERESFNSLIVL